MLRLYLDDDHGAGLIQCPDCGCPLLLGAQRMGRWVVGYGGSFVVRPGAEAMLVCPGYECDHVEPVQIAPSPDDAVVYSPEHAAGMFQSHERSCILTLDEMRHLLGRLKSLVRERELPKLHSAIKFWTECYRLQYLMVKEDLELAHDHGGEVAITLADERVERGRILGVLHDGVLLERTDAGGTIFLRAGQVRQVAGYGPGSSLSPTPGRFDFTGPREQMEGVHAVHTPQRYVVVGGHGLALDGVTRYGLCRVHSRDSKVAKALGLWASREGWFAGEFPGALVERCYRVIEYAYVQGFRLHVASHTNDRDVFLLTSREVEVARALAMTRVIMLARDGCQLRWRRYFRRHEIERMEEVKVVVPLPKARRRRRR